MWPFDGAPPTMGYNTNQGQNPNQAPGQNQYPLVRPNKVAVGGRPGFAAANSLAGMLTALQNMPKKAPGAPDPSQGSPGMGGMPAAPPDSSQGSPGAGGMPQASAGGIPSPPPMPPPPPPPSMGAGSPVPFGGMNGPGMGNMGVGDPGSTALMSQPPQGGGGLGQLVSDYQNSGMNGGQYAILNMFGGGGGFGGY